MKAGVNETRRIPCARKPDTHGHHPANEPCSYCPPARLPRVPSRDEYYGADYYGYPIPVIT